MDHISILLLEDSPIDAELVQERLRRERFDFAIERVDTREGFAEALRSRRFDLILADHSLPSFDGITALGMAGEIRPETPFIFVSATLGEEIAIDCLKRGATDYVLKQRLERLGPAIRRALDEVRERSARLAAQRALAQSEQQLRVTLASIGDAVIATDDAGMVTYMNPVAESLCGWASAEAAGHPLAQVFRIIDEATRAPAQNPVETVLRDGRIVGLSNHTLLVARDGTERPIDDSVAPIKNEQGQITGVVLVFRDVTDRRRAEEALRESERQFRQLADAIPQLAWMARPDGHVSWYNRGWYEYTGNTPEVMEGWGWQSVHDPEVLPAVLECWRRSIATGEPFEMVFPLRGADGRFRPFLSRANALRDSQGRVQTWFGTCTDIEKEKRAQQSLAERSEQLQRLTEISARLNAAHDIESLARVITNEARGLIGAHQAVTSLTLDPPRGQPINTISLSEKYAAWRGRPTPPNRSGLTRLVCEPNRPLRLTADELEQLPDIPKADDEPWNGPPLHGWLAAPLVGRSGRNLGVIYLSDKLEGDFTADDEYFLVQLAQLASGAIENARLYEELRANDRRKDEFLAMLAHELRNPLAAVNNALTILKLSHDEENRSWASDVVERQFRQLARLIDDLLDVSRITRGKIRLKRELLDVSAVAAAAVDSVRSLVEERRHELIVSAERGTLFVEADPTRLEQVLVNLLTNAAKYTESGGRIWLSAAREGPDVVLRVKDNGVGIPPDQLPRMFDLFAQGERSIARSEGGLGIGLTIVRTLVEMHGGSVAAASPGLGAGSEFTVRIPAAAYTATALVTPPAAAGVSHHRSRILVVDDNVDTARGLSRLLQLLGHEVRTAHDGVEALAIAGAYVPEFVLMDIGLPGMDGYAVARRLRDDPRCKDSVIIAVSGYGQEDDRRRSREAGFDYHFVKPVDHDALVAIIAQGGQAASSR